MSSLSHLDLGDSHHHPEGLGGGELQNIDIAHLDVKSDHIQNTSFKDTL